VWEAFAFASDSTQVKAAITDGDDMEVFNYVAVAAPLVLRPERSEEVRLSPTPHSTLGIVGQIGLCRGIILMGENYG